jgi:hypothetical protein
MWHGKKKRAMISSRSSRGGNFRTLVQLMKLDKYQIFPNSSLTHAIRSP